MESSPEARVLDAAYNLYVADGMEALSMRRVALQLGITAPALYKHFDNKDALIEAIADRGFELFEIMFVVPRTRRRRFPDDFAARRSISFNMARAGVEQAMEEKKFKKDDSLEVTLNLWAYAHGLVGLYRAGRFDANPAAFRRLFDRAFRRLLSGLAAK